ncbi:unnamed protein product [Adineta ricciae]|uniref:Uncharacterized protein n=1 Tax=Adineta ricciae TaxID=249248 RepID=A0A813VKY1_ADIRI|nr:unnamed protein product [Adineta ricciae]CAF1322522.1 unnamed protein product [Adineta ricciae]
MLMNSVRRDQFGWLSCSTGSPISTVIVSEIPEAQCRNTTLKGSEKRNSHPHGGPPGHQRRGSNDSNERGGGHGHGHGHGHGPGHKK